MNSAECKKIPQRQTPFSSFDVRRFAQCAVCAALGLMLSGCAVQPEQGGSATPAALSAKPAPPTITGLATEPAEAASAPASAASSEQTAPEQSQRPFALRPNWRERTWTSNPPAAVEVNKGSVTPYPGEPENGEGVTAYGAGLRPPVEAKPSASVDKEDSDDEDDAWGDIPGVLIDKGFASWYGGQFHGRLTANGERFDRTEMTAAHRTLPFGSRVCVRNSSTGKTVLVRINDRGPFSPGRVIDLSQAAAQELGIIGLGIRPVELWRLHKGSDSCSDDSLSADGASARAVRTSSRTPVARASASKTVRTQSAKKSAVKTASTARKSSKPVASKPAKKR